MRSLRDTIERGTRGIPIMSPRRPTKPTKPVPQCFAPAGQDVWRPWERDLKQVKS